MDAPSESMRQKSAVHEVTAAEAAAASAEEEEEDAAAAEEEEDAAAAAEDAEDAVATAEDAAAAAAVAGKIRPIALANDSGEAAQTASPLSGLSRQYCQRRLGRPIK